MMAIVLFIILLLVSSCVCPATQNVPVARKDRLSVLLLASNYIGHQFPLLALGEELVSRGHRVAIIGPLIEGSTVLSNLSQDVGVEFINAGFISRKVLEIVANLSKNTNVFNSNVRSKPTTKKR